MAPRMPPAGGKAITGPSGWIKTQEMEDRGMGKEQEFLGYCSQRGARPPLKLTPLVGKNPVLKDWQKLGSSDIDQVSKWMRRYPGCNFGLLTGKVNGIVVIDVDIKPEVGKYGDETLKALESKLGPLPETVEQRTGSGGRHLVFKYPPGVDYIKGRANIAPWVDIRGDGNQIVVSPSIHPDTRRQYEWLIDYDWEETPPADLPPRWLEWIQRGGDPSPKEEAKGEPFSLPDLIPDGQRNDTLFKYACSLRARGKKASDILKALERASAERCNPPMDSKELMVIYDSALKYDYESRDGTFQEEAKAPAKSGESAMDSFLELVQTRAFEPIPTGIGEIDRALDGGFMRKTLVTLGAPPAMGKTVIAQWIFENVAKGGRDVLYLNLEMAREQLIARSLSRIAWTRFRKDLTALEVLRGYEWTDEQRKAVNDAVGIYQSEVAPRMVYNPDGLSNKMQRIMAEIEKETERVRALGRPSPLVVLDYLQLIDTGERDAVEGLKNAIFSLKDYAKRNDTVVFCIIANNREANKSGTVEIDSGRDTSALEYNGDLMLGLVYTAVEDKRPVEESGAPSKNGVYDPKVILWLCKEAYKNREDPPKVCNEVSLKIVKNRFSGAQRRVDLLFDGAHSTYTTDLSKWEKAKETPFDRITKKS